MSATPVDSSLLSACIWLPLDHLGCSCGVPPALLCSAQPCVDMCVWGQAREMRLSLNPPAIVQRSSFCWPALTVFMLPEISLLGFMRSHTSLVSLSRFVLHKKYTFKANICGLFLPFFPLRSLASDLPWAAFSTEKSFHRAKCCLPDSLSVTKGSTKSWRISFF